MNSLVGVNRYLDPAAEEVLHRSQVPRRALFLDRDGIINVDHGYVHTPGQTRWVPGIFELCRAARDSGYLLVVVTNQAGIARGLYSESAFLDYTRWVHEEFSRQDATLLATYYCPHHPTTGETELRVQCECRKPAPGMILRAARELAIEKTVSVLLGDKASDIEAGLTAGVAMNILFGSEHEQMTNNGRARCVQTLAEVTQVLIEHTNISWSGSPHVGH